MYLKYKFFIYSLLLLLCLLGKFKDVKLLYRKMKYVEKVNKSSHIKEISGYKEVRVNGE